MKTRHFLLLATFLAFRAGAQSILFDFENAQLGSSLPLSLSVGGLTATFSATGAGGYYIQQPQNVIGVIPAGFSGNCLMPSAVYAADLHVAFSAPVTSFSIQYAPQELACDASANVSVTTYLNGVLVGANTTNATAFCADVPCTWPGQRLAFGSAHGFNSVVVHYVAPGSGCQNYGPIFLADNMLVTPAALPMQLGQPGHASEWRVSIRLHQLAKPALHRLWRHQPRPAVQQLALPRFRYRNLARQLPLHRPAGDQLHPSLLPRQFALILHQLSAEPQSV